MRFPRKLFHFVATTPTPTLTPTPTPTHSCINFQIKISARFLPRFRPQKFCPWKFLSLCLSLLIHWFAIINLKTWGGLSKVLLNVANFLWVGVHGDADSKGFLGKKEKGRLQISGETERERGKNREDFDFENAPRQKEKVERQKELFEVEIITKGKVKSQKAIGWKEREERETKKSLRCYQRWSDWMHI